MKYKKLLRINTKEGVIIDTKEALQGLTHRWAVGSGSLLISQLGQGKYNCIVTYYSAHIIPHILITNYLAG